MGLVANFSPGIQTRRRIVWIVALAFAIASVGACSGSEGQTTTVPTTEVAEPALASTTSPTVESTTTSTEAPETQAETTIWLGEITGQMVQMTYSVDDAGTLSGVVEVPTTPEIPELPLSGTLEDDAVTFEIPAIAATFDGTIDADRLSGTWSQSGVDLPVEFDRQAEPFVLSRPQEPVPPFPYETEEVRVNNAGISLAGTLVMPDGDGPFPGVVFATGSGAQDRDETLVGHRPFLVLADAFARSGIASVRFDDRGIGGSTGNPVGATTADLATDTLAAVEFLAGDPRVRTVIIVGHSEGGLVAPMVAGTSDALDGAVLLAGPGVPGIDLLVRQTEDLLRSQGLSETDIAWQMGWRREVMNVAVSDASTDEAAEQINAIVSTALAEPPADVENPPDPALVDLFTETFSDPWMRYFLSYDPRPALEGLTIPTLALIGSLDQQVAPDVNIPAIEAAVAGNPDAAVSELEGLNHLFQTAETGAISEYAMIEETFAPWAIDLIAGWILDHG